MDNISGGCLCGAIRFQASGAPDRVGLCHCLDCRKHHGAAFFAAAIFPEGSVTVSGQTSHFQDRHFCPSCGSSVFSKSDGEIELHLGAMDKPNQFRHDYELWTCRKESWLGDFDNIKSYETER